MNENEKPVWSQWIYCSQNSIKIFTGQSLIAKNISPTRSILHEAKPSDNMQAEGIYFWLLDSGQWIFLLSHPRADHGWSRWWYVFSGYGWSVSTFMQWVVGSNPADFSNFFNVSISKAPLQELGSILVVLCHRVKVSENTKKKSCDMWNYLNSGLYRQTTPLIIRIGNAA